MKRALAIGFAMLGGFATDAAACPDGAALSGDDDLVDQIGELLSRRGIATAGCAAVSARVERRGDAIAIALSRGDGAPIERVVNELATAATVIESFSRSDVAAPLLAIRARPASPPPEPAPVPSASPPSASAIDRPRSTVMRGVQLFGALEASVATDRTRWLGMHVGVCVTLGVVCAAARLRFSNLVNDEDAWAGGLDRGATELLVGLDIPLALTARLTLSPGFAAGLGAVHTGVEQMDGTSESAGLRADAHATLSIQLTRRIALDLSVSADLAQETAAFDTSDPARKMPDEPLAMARFGLGFRYGGM